MSKNRTAKKSNVNHIDNSGDRRHTIRRSKYQNYNRSSIYTSQSSNKRVIINSHINLYNDSRRQLANTEKHFNWSSKLSYGDNRNYHSTGQGSHLINDGTVNTKLQNIEKSVSKGKRSFQNISQSSTEEVQNLKTLKDNNTTINVKNDILNSDKHLTTKIKKSNEQYIKVKLAAEGEVGKQHPGSLPTNRFKKTEITNTSKRNNINDDINGNNINDINGNDLKSTQESQKSYSRSLDGFDQKIGKAYGDPDNYQPLGDGVYLLNDGSPKSKIKQLKDNLPDTQRSLNEILNNLEEEDSSILDGSKTGDVHIPLSVNNEPSEEQRGGGGRDLTVSIASKQNVEDVTPTEVNMINDIENSLRIDDKRANQHVFTGTDTNHHLSALEREEKRKDYDDILKAADSMDKEFIEEDPYVVKTSV